MSGRNNYQGGALSYQKVAMLCRLRKKKGLFVLGCTLLLIAPTLVFLYQEWHNSDRRNNAERQQWKVEANPFIPELLVTESQNQINQGKTDPQIEWKEEASSDEDLHTSNDCLQWVKLAPKPPYFLTAVLLIRIYEADKAKLTTAELKMWLQYLRYAGVEHVYIYDAWVYSNESQLSKLEQFVKDGYITYIDWHTHNPYTISLTQVAAYQNCIDVYKGETLWQVAIDIDEYPFSPSDQSPGFLFRYMKHFDENHVEVSEVTMQNFLFLGKSLDKELMIERLFRRTPNPSNPLVKPIYKPWNVAASIHHNLIHTGKTMNAPVDKLRINHYWGARLQNWGEDTPMILSMTEVDNSMEPIIRAFKQCKILVHHYL